jgi:hypothetical protein
LSFSCATALLKAFWRIKLNTVKNKHITEPDVFGYQVRIVRRGKETSRYFYHKLWGSQV